MADDSDPRPGLQIERTQLAWERTAFGYLAVTAVLLFHTEVDRLGPGRIVLAGVSTTLSLTVVVIARWRGRIDARPGEGEPPTVHSPAAAVVLTGFATAVLAILILLAAVLPGL